MDSSHYLGLPDDMQFRRHSDFYPAGGVVDKMASSVAPRSHSGDAIHGHPSPLRHGIAQGSSSTSAGLPQTNYMVTPQHDLYPAPPETHPRYRQSVLPHAPQSWPPYEHGLAMNMASGMPSSYDSFPTASPYPPPRLSPPPTSLSLGGFGSTSRHGPLAGSLDPTTGIFYRTPDHPRLRTAQACEKCRTRKAKCSGEHPSCKRCISRSLVCEYAKEGRVRGPNKPKTKPPGGSPEEQLSVTSARNRSSSTNTTSSTGSSEYYDIGQILTSLRDPRPGVPQGATPGLAHARRSSLSLGEHRANRPRPPNLQLESTSNHYQQNAYFPASSGSGQSHRDLPCHPATDKRSRDTSASSSFPQGYALSEPVAIPQYQPMYGHLDPGALLRDHRQSRTEFTIAQTQSPPLDHTHQLRAHHDGSSSSLTFETQHSYAQYQVPMEDLNTTYHQDYSPHDANANLEGLHPYSNTSPYNTQPAYLAPFLEGMQRLQESSQVGATSNNSNLTPLTSTWGDLEGASGPSSSVSESFSVPVSSNSSSIATASPFNSASHSFALALPEHLGQVASLSMEGPPVQNVSSSPGVSINPHQADAMRRGSASSLGENFSGETPFHLADLGYP